VSLKEAVKENKFTLIDFWYSHCQPCLQQLPDLKKLYTSYNANGFSIIGVSVDKKEHEADWQNVIQQFNLSWPQYIDLAGKEAINLGIDSYPTNFLVDDKGVIIKKDISTEELRDFLKNKLNR
jgi:thiol-disulfide isomerase/thioredoxin